MTEHPFSEDEVSEICYEVPDGYIVVSGEEITDQSRWSTYFRKVIKNVSSNQYWEITWSRGSTEQQDFGSEDIEITQVYPKEKTITVFERKL